MDVSTFQDGKSSGKKKVSLERLPPSYFITVSLLTPGAVLHDLSERLEKDIGEMLISKGDTKKARERRQLRAPLEKARKDVLKEESIQEEFEQEQRVLFETRRAEQRVRFLRSMRPSEYPGASVRFEDGYIPEDQIYFDPQPHPPDELGPDTGPVKFRREPGMEDFIIEREPSPGDVLSEREPNTYEIIYEERTNTGPILSRRETSTGPRLFRREPNAETVRFEKELKTEEIIELSKSNPKGPALVGREPNIGPDQFGRDLNLRPVVIERERRPWARNKRPERDSRAEQMSAEQARLRRERHELNVERQKFEDEKRQYEKGKMNKEQRERWSVRRTQQERRRGDEHYRYPNEDKLTQGELRFRERASGRLLHEDGQSRRRRGGELRRYA